MPRSRPRREPSWRRNRPTKPPKLPRHSRGRARARTPVKRPANAARRDSPCLSSAASVASVILRCLFYLLLVCAGAFASPRADARLVETRAQNFFAPSAETHQENQPQVADPHQENLGHRYELASGCSLAAESGLPAGVNYSGTVSRAVNPKYASSAWDVTAQNIASNHRYTSVGRGGLYTSTSQDAMLAEMRHYGIDMSSRSVLSRQVNVGNILDLTNPAVRRQLGVSLEQISGDSYHWTHALGDFAQGRYNGILAPSARQAGTSNLILFDGF